VESVLVLVLVLSRLVLSCIRSVALIELIEVSLEVESLLDERFSELQAITIEVNAAASNKIRFFISDKLL
jgi:hypothetical protein